MRQSKSKKRETTASLYLRLSRDDNLEGESYSIGNQKKLLTKVAKEKGYTNLLIYIDDGISGVTMNRPDYIRMIEDFENNKFSALFVKDLSRIGRNYIEVGKLTEEFLPEHDIRLVAVSDNIDTDEGENELAPIKNLFNEWYARDISKKRRISNKIKGNSGEPLSSPPYGYMKNPDDKKTWLIDEEAATVVRRVFTMTQQDIGTEQIAVIFEQEKILTPVYYAESKGIRKPHRKGTENPYAWCSTTVLKILNTQEYCGDIINFKTYSKSYKNKKRYANDPENIVVFKDVNPAIVERAVFEKIQEKRGKMRKRKKADGEKNIFSGLLVCADCGSNLNFHFNQGNREITYFNCTGYNRGKRKICESSHYIRTDFLEQVVLGEIRRLTKFATKYETEFAKLVMGSSVKSLQEESQFKEKELKALQTRDKELDMLFEKIYEDNAMGKISDDRFAKMSVKYEDEQKAVNEKMQKLKDEISASKSKNVSTDMFIATVQKYTRARKLTPQMLNELIEKIEVYQSEKIDGKTIQKLKIHYTCVGTLDIPDMDLIPENNVSVHTRQGVDVHFNSRICAAV